MKKRKENIIYLICGSQILCKYTNLPFPHTCSRIHTHIQDMEVEVKLSGVPKKTNRKKEGLREGRTGVQGFNIQNTIYASKQLGTNKRNDKNTLKRHLDFRFI